MNRNWLLGILVAATALLIGGCIWQSRIQENSRAEESVTKQLFAMDTYMTFTAYGSHAEEAVEAAAEEVKRLDALLSTGISTSEIYKINQTGMGTVSEDTRNLLTRALEIQDSTGGLFDITIYPLMELWGFPTQEYRVPDQTEIDQLLPYVDGGAVSLKGDQVTLKEGQKIDLGAIAKGYTSDRLMEIYRQHGVTSGMVYLGGNVQTLNTKPDGSRWNIGIQAPDGGQGSVLASVEVDNCAVITSGGYERYFEQDGKTYIHILDPRTGYPVENDLSSVTVISEDGTLADALSTSLFIMGKAQASAYWQEHQEEFEMILVTKEGTLLVTEGLLSDLHTEEPYEVISKS
jgi:thiamine biosynthesis lipoprotein